MFSKKRKKMKNAALLRAATKRTSVTGRKFFLSGNSLATLKMMRSVLGRLCELLILEWFRLQAICFIMYSSLSCLFLMSLYRCAANTNIQIYIAGEQTAAQPCLACFDHVTLNLPILSDFWNIKLLHMI